MKRRLKRGALFLAGTIVVGGILPGCGGGGGGGSTDTGKATIVLSADATTRSVDESTRGAPGGPIPVDQIANLFVTVTNIELERVVGSEDNPIPPTPGADDSVDVTVRASSFDPTSVTVEQGGRVTWQWQTAGAHTITSGLSGDVDAGALFDVEGATTGQEIELVFADVGVFPYFSDTSTDIAAGMSGVVEVVPDASEGSGSTDDDVTTLVNLPVDPVEIDLINLTVLSEVLSSADVPVGRYKGIRLTVANPRLFLAAAPTTEITDVQITGNGVLRIAKNFNVELNDDELIVLTLGTIHLVDTGSGYVLTPQVRISDDDDDAEVRIEGDLVSINDAAQILVVRNASGTEFEVLVTGDTVILRDLSGSDSGSVPATFAEFVAGQILEVEGMLSAANVIDALKVEIEDESANEVRITGTITSIDADSRTLVVNQAGTPVSAIVREEARIKISSDQDIILEFADLVTGLRVHVEGHPRQDGSISADEVEVEAEEEFNGSIASINAELGTITVETGSGSRTAEVVDGTEIRDDDTDTLVFSDLAVGQQVEVRGATLAGERFVTRRIRIDGVV